MLSKHKQPSLEGGLLIILVVISIFGMGYYTENKITGIASTQITGDMVKVTGMEVKYFVYQNNEWRSVAAPPTTGSYMIETSSGKYLVEDGKYYKLQTGGWDKNKNYIDEVKTELTSSPPPPPSGAPQPPTAPTPPPAPAPSPENVPTGKVTLANDNQYYYKWPDGRLQVYDQTTWRDITYTYTLTIRDSAGITQVIRVEAPTLTSAQNYQVPAGTTVINAVKVTDNSVTPTGTFTPTKIMDKDAVTNGQFTYFVPQGKNPAEYTTELNDKAKINDAYNKWRTSQNLPDTIENRKLFRDYPPSGINANLIDTTLGLTPAQQETPQKLPYTSIKLPNDQYMFKYDVNGDGTIQQNEIFIQSSSEPSGNLKNILEFKQNHPTAVLQTNYMSDGNRVYLENGIYISEATGQKIDSMTETRDIGTTKATVYYTLTAGTAKKIDHIEINEISNTQMDMDTFNKIKSLIDPKTAPSGSNGKITYTNKDGRTIEVDISTYKDGEGTDKDGIWEGTRAITTSFPIYLDAQGNQISKEQYNSLIEKGETLPNPIQIKTTEKEEFEKGEIIVKSSIFGEDETKQGQVLKTYYWEKLIVRDGKVNVEGMKVDAKTNELLEFTLRVYDENGNTKEITLNKDGTYKSGDQTLLPEAQTRQSQLKSRQWFADFEFKLTQFKGLAGWSQLIFSDEELAKWREGVDKLFSTFYLGTDYWSSAICSKYIPKQQKGLLTMKTKDSLFDVVAHVEGERTLIPKTDGTKQYIYKLTFSVRNPKYSQYDKLRFNVYLYGQKTVKLYEQDINVEDGKSFTRGTGEMEDGQVTYTQEHGKPIVQYSDFLYDKICIKFINSITNAEGNSEDEVCNSIVEYQGSPTKYKQRTIPTTPETPGAPGEPYQEADF